MRSISIAMATYNGQRFIREQLDSLAAQQHLPSELVIADGQDGGYCALQRRRLSRFIFIGTTSDWVTVPTL